jgi:hypothetical protein
MQPITRHALLLSALLCVTAAAEGTRPPRIHNITLTARHLYGPGPLPDQKLGAGHVHNMPFARFMDASVPGTNNGASAPNVSGESLQGTTIDGKLSDGTLINENIDMGHVLLLQGRFNLLLAAVHGGPNKGVSRFFLDDKLNWTIQDDIAIDPGFAEGIVKIKDFKFTTGPTFVPQSVQTQRGYPGGIDMVGSLRSGDVIAGRIGDDDLDGRVDGIFIALGNFPLEAILLPGAPFVQTIEFVSDIPLHSLDAAMLSLAAARNRLAFIGEQREAGLSSDSVRDLLKGAQERLAIARRHLERARTDSACARQCEAARRLAPQVEELSVGDDPAAAQAVLPKLDTLTRELAALHKARTGKEVV